MSNGSMAVLGRYFKFKFKEIAKNKALYLYMAPFAILFITFTLAPVVASIVLSFTSFNVLQPPRFIGIDNYYRLFMQDDLFIIAVKNTIVFSAILGPVGYLLSLIFAWLINEMPPKIRAVMTLLFYTPSIAGGACVAVFQYIFNSDSQGFVNSLLLKAGFILSPIQFFADEKTMAPTVIGILLWMSIGTGFLSIIAGLQNVDRSLYEAGIIDGVKNRWQELWFITLPSIKPQLLFAAVMSITGSFGIGGAITAYVGFPSPNYAMHTMVNHMEDYGTLRFEMGYSLAISTLLFLFMIYANKAVQYLLRRVGT